MAKKQTEKQTNVERFYAWLQRCNSIYLADSARLEKAFNKIPNI